MFDDPVSLLFSLHVLLVAACFATIDGLCGRRVVAAMRDS